VRLYVHLSKGKGRAEEEEKGGRGLWEHDIDVLPPSYGTAMIGRVRYNYGPRKSS
jgi:hypothetical protein